MDDMIRFLVFFALILDFVLMFHIYSAMGIHRRGFTATETHQKLVRAIERGEFKYSATRLNWDVFGYADKIWISENKDKIIIFVALNLMFFVNHLVQTHRFRTAMLVFILMHLRFITAFAVSNLYEDVMRRFGETDDPTLMSGEKQSTNVTNEQPK